MNDRIFKRYKNVSEKAYKLLETDIDIYVRTTKTSTDFDDIFDEPVDPNATAYNTRIVRLKGIFTWIQGDLLNRLPPGTERSEIGYLHVRLNDVLTNPADVTQGTIFDDTEKVVVDGVECKVASVPRKVGINKPYNVIVTLERSV